MASKIKKIEILNLKSLSELTADFNGCTAIITGANNSGKTTLLRSIPDRIRGEKPDLIVKQGEKAGKGVMTLTSGESFEWEFDNEKKDKLVFITKEGFKVAVTKEISNKFFPPVFDIDVFLNSTPKAQATLLQRLAGLDFTVIDLEYKNAYDERTVANRTYQAEKTKLSAIGTTPKEVSPIDIKELLTQKDELKAKLNAQYLQNKSHNDSLRSDYELAKQQEETIFDKAYQNELAAKNGLSLLHDTVTDLKQLGVKWDDAKLEAWMSTVLEPTQAVKKEIPQPEYVVEMPDDSEMIAIDEKIANANLINEQASSYKNYMLQVQSANEAKDKADMADAKVKEIEERKSEMIRASKLPEGIELTEDGLKVDGFVLDKNQISTSKLYCTALRLAALNLGEVKTLHFDASPLDKNTLADIEKWAKENDMQLLIEMPDRDAGDIKYTLICDSEKAE